MSKPSKGALRLHIGDPIVKMSGSFLTIFDERGSLVATAPTDEYASLIVKSVNQSKKLVEALREGLVWLKRFGIDNRRISEMSTSCHICLANSHFEPPSSVVLTHKPECIIVRAESLLASLE